METQRITLKPFPEVKVVKQLLNPKWAAQYREQARPRRIEFGVVLLGMGLQSQKIAVYHEVGHWFRCEHRLPLPARGEKGEEMFAEGFAQFMISPADLKKRDEASYRFFEDLVRGHKKTLDTFAREILRGLSREGALYTLVS